MTPAEGKSVTLPGSMEETTSAAENKEEAKLEEEAKLTTQQNGVC